MIDTRRYQSMIGAIGLTLVVAFSTVMYLAPARRNAPGVATGGRLHRFVAPLATSDLNAAANVAPRCDPAHPARRGLNVCDRAPIVLAFFATDAAPCVRAVTALQRLAGRYPGTTFAAVAAGAGRGATLRLVRRHRWTIAVAYDAGAAVAQLYDATVCPLIEVARRDGIVSRRLIGRRWAEPAALAAALDGVLSHRR